ncbi:hypothetical protein PI124_g6326 [Phytophthora idaei]|nr:hypothetical protein PI126_g969 [Phytophthora idaei]KAG3249014.1 hypothetical protein PI124_g6326 [Phytophthora idaei]
MILAVISSTGIQAQDVGTVTAANPEATAAPVDTTTPVATDPAAPVVTTATPVATDAVTTPPVATEAATTPVATEAPTTSTPVSTPPPPAATDAVIVTTAPSAPVSTDPPTTSTPTAAPSTAQVASESSTPILQDTTSPQSNLRGSDADTSTSASSQSSSSKSVSESITGTLDGLSSTKTTVICLLGGVGIVIIMCLLFVVWRTRGREDPELGTPIAPDSATITSPPASSAPAWKAKGASFASQNVPLAANTRAKMNATTRLSAEYDMTNRLSQIASLPAHNTSGKPSRANRETNASSERSFSVRGHSEFSVHHEGDSETSVMTNERYSTNDIYSTGDRFSTSSRLSSEVVRGNSGWFQRPVPKNLDMHRFSSTSSTASSVVARKHNKVSFVNHDLTQTPSNETPVTTDSTTSRTDVPDWYRVIESPSDNDRYTTSSLDSDNISSERESFEL